MLRGSLGNGHEAHNSFQDSRMQAGSSALAPQRLMKNPPSMWSFASNHNCLKETKEKAAAGATNNYSFKGGACGREHWPPTRFQGHQHLEFIEEREMHPTAAAPAPAKANRRRRRRKQKPCYSSVSVVLGTLWVLEVYTACLLPRTLITNSPPWKTPLLTHLYFTQHTLPCVQEIAHRAHKMALMLFLTWHLRHLGTLKTPTRTRYFSVGFLCLQARVPNGWAVLKCYPSQSREPRGLQARTAQQGIPVPAEGASRIKHRRRRKAEKNYKNNGKTSNKRQLKASTCLWIITLNAPIKRNRVTEWI